MPQVSHRQAPWPHWERHGAGHPYADSHNQPKSAVISRDWTVETNLSMGTETLIPSRLLYGVVPAALLEAYEFWQDEVRRLLSCRADAWRSVSYQAVLPHTTRAFVPTPRTLPRFPRAPARPAVLQDDHMRGYARDPEVRDIIYVRIGVGSHVAFAGSRFNRLSASDKVLPPARALVMRLQKTRLKAARDGVNAALQTLEAFVREKELLSKPFEPNFQICKAVSVLLRKIEAGAVPPPPVDDAVPREAGLTGDDEEDAMEKAAKAAPAAAASKATQEAAEALDDWLRQVDLTPFARHRKRHRLSHIVLPALLDAVATMMEGDAADEEAAKKGPSDDSAAEAAATSDGASPSAAPSTSTGARRARRGPARRRRRQGASAAARRSSQGCRGRRSRTSRESRPSDCPAAGCTRGSARGCGRVG